MFRVPESGNGVRSPDYSLVMPLFGPAGPGAGVAVGEFDPRAADPQDRRCWSGAGGRWLLWPLRVLLWSALLIIAYWA